MIPPPDPAVVEFRTELPRHVRDHLHDTQAIVALIHAAVRDHGWTPRLLARECSRDLEDVLKPGGVVTARLRKAATHPPVGVTPHPSLTPLPFCSPDCADRRGWLLDPDTLLPVGRCPCRARSPARQPA